MSAKEQFDKAMTALKKTKPYLIQGIEIVKTASRKIYTIAAPLLKKGYGKIKEIVSTQIKKYQDKQTSAQQKKEPTNTDTPEKK